MPFWEGCGNEANDLSGNRTIGTFTNEASWAAVGIEVDGVNDYIDLGIPSSLKIGPALTVSIWAKRDTTSNNYEGLYACIKTSADYGGYGLWSMSDGRIRGSVDDNYINDVKTTDVISNSVWHHIVLRCDGVNYAVYVDGKKASADKAISAYTPADATTIKIGFSFAANEYFDGMLDNPMVFDWTLTPGQIKFIYENPNFMYKIPEELYGYVAAVGGWTGEIIGITNPSEILGRATSGFSEVIGI